MTPIDPRATLVNAKGFLTRLATALQAVEQVDTQINQMMASRVMREAAGGAPDQLAELDLQSGKAKLRLAAFEKAVAEMSGKLTTQSSIELAVDLGARLGIADEQFVSLRQTIAKIDFLRATGRMQPESAEGEPTEGNTETKAAEVIAQGWSDFDAAAKLVGELVPATRSLLLV